MFPSIPCRWKVLGICAEGFWIRANFLFGLDGWKDIEPVKSI